MYMSTTGKIKMLFSRILPGLALIGIAAGENIAQSPSNEAILGTGQDECPARLDLTVEALLGVLETMQHEYFAPWLGTWDSAIDWTAAVMETHVSAALSTISQALDLVPATCQWARSGKENTVTLYFSEVLSFYFSQDHFAIRNEAYDDILWVVLGWLETIQFINLRTSTAADDVLEPMEQFPAFQGRDSWHGKIWIPAFAHRARIFWNLAKQGWDRDLCGGGMVWNPRLEPYKNAITNQLFISASSAMYLHFPGDWNHSPFSNGVNISDSKHVSRPTANDVFSPSDPAFRNFALEAYKWLQDSGMMNTQGLYTDGFHISGWNDGSSNTKCDVRNEQVYTYNQGVILTGQLNLWKITGNYSYMEDGHALIESVITATGWDLDWQAPVDSSIPSWDEIWAGWRWSEQKLPVWHGLGRAGVIEDACDSEGTCSQDSQTFKGIFFHHLATFCGAGTPSSRRDFLEANDLTDAHIAAHIARCSYYRPWLWHNTHAMLRTRNNKGKIGTWWTAGLLGLDKIPAGEDFSGTRGGPGAVDYRNKGVPDDPLWKRPPPPTGGVTPPLMPQPRPEKEAEADMLVLQMRQARNTASSAVPLPDLNDRGRGRTVETQSGGLAMLRAYWEINHGPWETAAPGQPPNSSSEAGPDEL